jgi:hypothetical protein
METIQVACILEHRELREDEFWREIPAFAKVSQDEFLDYKWQIKNSISDLRKLVEIIKGVKPSECFWWPVHIYGTEPENLEFCVATRCCTACEYIDANSLLLDDITKRVCELGTDVICRFRRVYSGSYEKQFLRKL